MDFAAGEIFRTKKVIINKNVTVVIREMNAVLCNARWE